MTSDVKKEGSIVGYRENRFSFKEFRVAIVRTRGKGGKIKVIFTCWSIPHGASVVVSRQKVDSAFIYKRERSKRAKGKGRRRRSLNSSS